MVAGRLERRVARRIGHLVGSAPARHGVREREVRGADPALADEHRAPDDVAELAHVAGPTMGQQRAGGVVLEAAHGAPELETRLVEKAGGERHDIVAPCAKRRQRDRKLAQSIVEIFAERPAPGRRLERDVARSDDAHVDRRRCPRADAPHHPLLENAEELGLRRRGQVRDLVEKQRAAVGEAEVTFLATVRPRERALFVAEQLGLDQRVGDGAAVDADERTVAPPALVMDGAGDELFARARLALDENRERGARYLADPLDHGLDLGAAADEGAERIGLHELRLEVVDLGEQRLPLDRATDLEFERRRIGRLREVIVGAELHRFDGRTQVVDPRQHDHRRAPRHLARLPQHLHAAESRQVEVEDHDGRAVLPDQLDGGDAVPGFEHLEAFLGQEIAQHLPDLELVVHDQNLRHRRRYDSTCPAGP